MALQDFIKIEQDVTGGVVIYLIHRKPPPFTVQMTPRYGRDGRIRGGEIRRIRFANSATGGYQCYAKLVTEAERFFERSIEVEARAPEPRLRRE